MVESIFPDGKKDVYPDFKCLEGKVKLTSCVQDGVIMESLLVGKKDIAETVTFSDDFSTFAAALNATDLLEVLKVDGPYTVFAPTDDAFASLPVGTLEYLFKPENKSILTCIVRYHLVSGRIMVDEIAKRSEIKALNGEMLTVTAKYGRILVDCATIMVGNIECSNGVIHAIDLVAIPKRWL